MPAEKQSRTAERSACAGASAIRRKLKGTPGKIVIPSFSISSRARWRRSRNGFGSSRITSVAPVRAAANMQQPMP